MLLVDKVKAWRSEGERDVIIVYHHDLTSVIIVLVLVQLPLLFLSLLLFPRALVLMTAVAFVLRTLAEGRRALIFTPSQIMYRPPFGRVEAVAFSNIASTRLCTIFTLFLLRPRLVSAVELTILNGDTIAMPLDFKDWPAIVNRLVPHTGLKPRREI
jgi:hypothetical protein